MKLPLATMTEIAQRIVDFIAPYCTRIEMAGSIRRKCAECGDIDIVCIPITHAEPSLLEEPSLISHLDSCPLQEIGKITANGPRLKKLLVRYQGMEIAVQINAVLPPAEWGVKLLIGTGPAEFSKRSVTSCASSWGFLSAAHYVKDGALWRKGDNTKVSTPEEVDFLKFLHMKPEYYSPEKRDRYSNYKS